ncbi:MAG: cytochrome d ubiquinol oxidase subunit I [Myxococcota bacterium]|jgi:cytochrome d ubiquinol oxidase subunit I
MTDLLAARSQMAMSLGFHILFAVAGMAMPVLMAIAEGMWLRTGDDVYLTLAKRWSRGTAILFAVGAVSGTVLSFELGLLWPGFMEFAGPIIGMPFSLEGFAFFLEAIFLGIYLYGWDRISPRLHWLAGIGVGVSGVLSGVFVVCANAWMNSPAGFTMVEGVVTEIRPLEAMLNPAAPTQTTHMVLAAFVSVGWAVAAIHAWRLLKSDSRFHRKALTVALALAIPATLLQPLSGHMSGEYVAEDQPLKLAAMEAHWETEGDAALLIGGIVDEEAEETRYAIKIPYALSLLAHRDPHAEVIGLKEWPPEDRPPVMITHLAFDVMVGAGTFMAAVGAMVLGMAWRARGLPTARWLLRLIVACGPLGFLALEAGWVVTEVGRQPWVARGLLRTADAVTPMPGLIVPFTTFTLLYLFLGWVVIVLLKRHVLAADDGEDDHA